MECTINNVPIYYESYGTGTPIIMIHGFTPDHRLMTGCMEPLFEQRSGWRRIYLDLPGMGRTPGMDHINSTDDILDIVLGFIDVLIPGQRFLIAGESYGGYLARAIVARRFEMVAGMALICPGIIMDPSKRDIPPLSIFVKDPQLLASLDPDDAENFSSIAVIQDQYNWERFRDDILPGLQIADQAFLDKIRRNYDCSFDIDKLPRPFEEPVVIVLGRQDNAVGYRDALSIIENYPHGTFAILDRAGHNAHFEQTSLFNTLMGEWLDRVHAANS